VTAGALAVGEVARRSGVPVSTIHFYEARGLIESWRTAGNQRRYARGVLRRVAIIRVGQRAGVPLAVLKTYLDAMPAGAALRPEDWNRLARAWQAMLDERIESLRQLRDELDGCIGCGCLSRAECPLRNPGDRLGREGPGPRLLGQRVPGA